MESVLGESQLYTEGGAGPLHPMMEGIRLNIMNYPDCLFNIAIYSGDDLLECHLGDEDSSSEVCVKKEASQA